MLTFALAVSLGLVAGNGIRQVSNSAPTGTMLVHADLGPVIGAPGDTLRARLLYSADSQRTWTERPMLRMAEPGYDSAWQAEVAVPSGPGRFWYYVNVDDSAGFATQSPLNVADSWPVPGNLLARIALDPVGDLAPNSDGPWLDLTGARVGRSEERFYVELANNHSSWPTSGGLFKWYAYSFGFSNPEAPSDSWVFAPIYVSAWPVMVTGLFAVNRYTGATPERIGDVEASTSGNRLLLRCRISDIAGDSRFGPWPNSQSWLIAAAATQTITTSGAVTNDTTVPGLFHALNTQRPVLGSNRPFALTIPRVVPDSGGPGTEFSFSVSYTDPDSNPPTVRLVRVGSDSFRLAPDSRRYWRGTTFRARQSGFAPGRQVAVFRFSDGAAVDSVSAEFFVGDTVGVREPADAARIEPARQLPGVVRGRLYLDAGMEPADSYVLVDASGRKVMELPTGRNDLSRLAPGVYFITTGRECRVFHRFVLVR